MSRTEKVTFTGSQGASLAARLDLPDGPVRAYALFAHCFTCSKDIFAATRIAAALTEAGIATLRFDFTGLGASEGEFANTDFSSNVEDLIAAADYLGARHGPPAILIGHSLGGAAVLAAAARIPAARAVATIGAPADAAHVRHLLSAQVAEIEARGEAEVELAGRRFRIRKAFLDDIAGARLEPALGRLGKALLIFHAPRDATVGIDNAGRIFQAARHPKSFVSLDDADHLLSVRADAAYVAQVTAAWASRYLPDAPPVAPDVDDGAVVVSENGLGPYGQDIRAGRNHIRADEPESVGGRDAGFTPYQLLSAALGACTSMTLRMYAARKGWPLGPVRVAVHHDKIHAEDCAACETRVGRIDRFRRVIDLGGALDAEQRARLFEIADKCPVHRTLHAEVQVLTEPSEDGL